MDKDRVTIRHTIGFGMMSNLTPKRLVDYINFLNYYMWKGPEELLPVVKRCLPIDGRRENLIFGLRIFISDSGWFLSCTILPIILYLALWRLLTMATCRVPVWPDWVEAE